MAKVQDRKNEIRLRAEQDFETFIRIVHPDRILGAIHLELIEWMTRQEAKTHQLILLPRDHQKSAMAAYYVAWQITRNPAIRILYVSATSTLAVKQLKFIKDILTSANYTFYWPEMVNEKDNDREKWTETEISVDHPLRKKENIRDATIFTAGLTTTITGLHCDLIVLDDIVVDSNAYSPEGRSQVQSQASYLASIAGTEGRQIVVGTRYHPRDLYSDFLAQTVTLFDEDTGEEVDSYSLYEVFERQVESRGDGTGEYIWPRQQRKDGKWFGFNQAILAQKKAQYFDQGRFRSQYYNDPSDSTSSAIQREHFQYYNQKAIKQINGDWYYGDRKLNIVAGIDFAYSLSNTADYTAIVVLGIDSYHNYYILDIERFKTNLIKEYFDKILSLYNKWEFRKLRAEITAAQSIIVKDLKENYIKPNNLILSIDENRPTKQKEERVAAALNSKYQNLQMWHYRGGNCSSLEEELISTKPPHDDIKDCLAAIIEIAVAPQARRKAQVTNNTVYYNERFGGLGTYAIITLSGMFGYLFDICSKQNVLF